MPHGNGAFVEVCGKVCSAKFGEERLTERVFISCGYPLEIEVVEGRPAVESECAGHPLSEQLLAVLTIRPQNVGVAHVRACRNHWNHTRGPARWHKRLKGKRQQGMSQDSNTRGRFTRKNNPEPHEQRDCPDSVWVLNSHGAERSKEHHVPGTPPAVSLLACLCICGATLSSSRMCFEIRWTGAATSCSTVRFSLYSSGMMFPTVSSMNCGKEMFNIIGGTLPTICSSMRSRMRCCESCYVSIFCQQVFS